MILKYIIWTIMNKECNMKPNTLREATLACDASNSRWISEIVDWELFSLELCSSKFSIFWESSKISASFSDRAASFRAITSRNFEFAFSRPVILSNRRWFSASKTSVFCCSLDRSLFCLKTYFRFSFISSFGP